MWATTRCQISLNILARFLISESQNGPDMIPCPKAWTIKASSWVWRFTTNAPNLFIKSFKGSPCLCFTPKRSKGTSHWTWLTMNCSLNNLENWSKKVMWPFGKPINHCSVVPVNVPINILQCITFVPLEIIIWALNAVRWTSGSFAPVKTILGVMNLAGMTSSIISSENGLGRALGWIVGPRSLVECLPSCCRYLNNSSLALRNSSLLARDASISAMNWSLPEHLLGSNLCHELVFAWAPTRLKPLPWAFSAQPWMSLSPFGEHSQSS